MKHLSYDELFRLSEASVNQEGFDDEQIEQLEHLKTCRDCYESFCLLSSLADIMSESGSYMLDKKAAVSIVTKVENAVKTKVLAKIQVIRNAASTTVGAVLEQIDQETAALKFGPSLAMATRGGRKTESTAIRLEEFEDDKTYIVFKPESNELEIQVNVRGMRIDNLRVYVEFADSTTIDIPVTKRGNIAKGSLKDISNCDFQVYIEAE